jgi:hypothetical protein
MNRSFDGEERVNGQPCPARQSIRGIYRFPCFVVKGARNAVPSNTQPSSLRGEWPYRPAQVYAGAHPWRVP